MVKKSFRSNCRQQAIVAEPKNVSQEMDVFGGGKIVRQTQFQILFLLRLVLLPV
jgi:hypothetical protein